MKNVMKRKPTLLLLALGVLICMVSPAKPAPKPSEVPISWQLEFHAADVPHPIRVRVPGKSTPETFWYMRYTVTNRTGEDRIFVPDFVLYTDTGQVVRSGKRVPLIVFETVKKLHNDVLLTNVTGMTGKILQGEDNAKDGVAIFRDFDPKAGEFDIFVGGLSGETVELVLPRPIKVVEVDVKTGEKKKVTKTRVVLTRTLHLRYKIPGEQQARFRTKARLAKKTWVMR